MLLQSNYCKPPNSNIARYAASLYGRIHEAQYVAKKNVCIGSWQPLQNHCHANALILETFGEGYTAVHGWFFLDFKGNRDYVRFTAHSVVMTADGQLLDVTPSRPDLTFPFIAAGLGDLAYENVLNALLKKYGTTECLDYRP